MVSNQQFRLKWNNHRNTVFNEFETLLHNNSFVDCTIGADGKYLKAHKIVLSACSPYLQNVFSEHFDKHPVILLKDVSFKELKCMIDYMYCGEVNISECELPSFLRTAQSLKIKGLAEDINNDYDSTSDSEQQEVGSFSENGRTIEANVEIHDDDGPPAKKSTPSLVSTSVNNSFTGRKRKTPAAGKITSQNKIAPINTSNTRKCADINVPNTVNKTENSDNTLCSTTKENCVKQDETNDNNRKISSQNDTQELVNSRTEVKEELVDTDADNDDNSSYECMNNPCEDSDPLNEDSESNCTNTGNKFSEVSIASLSSYNENGNVSNKSEEQNEMENMGKGRRQKFRNVKFDFDGYDAGVKQRRSYSHSEDSDGRTNDKHIVRKKLKKLKNRPRSFKQENSVFSDKSASAKPNFVVKKPKFTCDECGKIYRWKEGLASHKRLYCGKEPKFKCPHCEKKTFQKINLDNHISAYHPA